MGRRLQSTVPIVSDELKPRQANNELLRQRERDYEQRQKHNYDRRHRATNLDKLEPNDNVYVKDQKIWGKVKQDSYTPRSYIVETESGDVMRNRRHLAKVKTGNDEQSDIEITVKKSADLPKQNDSEHYTKYENTNTLLKKAQSLNIKVDKDYEIVHERMT